MQAFILVISWEKIIKSAVRKFFVGSVAQSAKAAEQNKRGVVVSLALFIY